MRRPVLQVVSPPRPWRLRSRQYRSVLELEPQNGSVSTEPRELAFMDCKSSSHSFPAGSSDNHLARRFGRIRLLPHPVTDHPPVSALGFDPVLSYPSLEEFRKLLEKKKGTIKGVIMDQGFSAGVGNVRPA